MKRFLIVDDSSTFRTLLKIRLQQKWPETVVETYDPESQGLPADEFNWNSYDLIFLDYDLGLDECTGIDLIPAIKKCVPKPAIIMLTGQGNEKLAIKAMRAGADDYLAKYDVVTDKLYEMIQDVLDEQSCSVQNFLENDYDYLNRWQIPGYRCISEISVAYSLTLSAERLKDSRPVILKIQPIEDSGVQSTNFRRFTLELNILSKLQHPNLIELLDHGINSICVYYVMDYFSHGDLAKLLENKKLTPDKAKMIILQIANGLECLHQNNIIHRDIKPNNILFKDENTVMVADLGSAKNLLTNEALTLTGNVIGSPIYMSPEQLNGKQVDARTDIYSLGVMFYELLTGYTPYRADTIMAMVYKHLYEKPEKLPDKLCDYQSIIDKMLAKQPGERYQNISEFITDVENFS